MGKEEILGILAVIHAAVFFSLVLSSAITDTTKGRIYNWPVATALIIGFFLSYLRGGAGMFWSNADHPIGLFTSIAGMFAAGSLFMIAYLVGGLAAGDVKLMAAVGALSGLKFTLWAMIHTAIAGVPLALIVLISKGKLKEGLRGVFRSFLLLKKKKVVQEPEKLEQDVDDSSGKDASDSLNDTIKSSEGVNTDTADEEYGVTIPYAVAIAIGCIWTVILYVKRGTTLPFMQ